MEYRALGNCGLKVSKLSFGGWATFGETVKDQQTVSEILRHAYESGVNFFDMADIYGGGESERMMGKVLGEFPRHRLVLTSKVFWPASEDVNDCGLSRKHIMESIEKSLKRIGVDYLDIYYCHRFDEHTPLEETIRAMDDLVHQGKILYWGSSEWNAQQLTEAHAIANFRNLYRPQVEQPMYNLLVRKKVETTILPLAKKTGMGVVSYSPLASGFLTGKYDQGIPDESRFSRMEFLRDWFYNQHNIQKLNRFKKIAAEVGCSRAQLALAWTAAQPGISSVLTGATRVDQIKDNLKAAEIEINAELNQELNELFPVDPTS
ncbi:MAG TPA: aldo/keto reductase [bacterium]|nr:aldo/keto reductase [bacterium]